MLSLAYFDMYSHFNIYVILRIFSNNTYTDSMNRRKASSLFSTPEPKHQDLPLHIVVDDLHNLFDDELLSPLMPLEDSLVEVSKDEEVPPSLIAVCAKVCACVKSIKICIFQAETCSAHISTTSCSFTMILVDLECTFQYLSHNVVYTSKSSKIYLPERRALSATVQALESSFGQNLQM